jgi:membrane-bound metal-dependent hydrolase YbcI (DUF457 family)
MLPPGHIAAGYLVGRAVLYYGHPDITASQRNILLFLGCFFAFAPDFDFLYVFFKEKGFVIKKGDTNHRKLLSHAPVLWLIVGLVIYSFASDDFWRYVGLFAWLCSWSHFLMDSIQHGVMWLWPFSTRSFALKDPDIKHPPLPSDNFISHWLLFLKFYAYKVRWTFYAEVLVLLAALYFLI